MAYSSFVDKREKEIVEDIINIMKEYRMTFNDAHAITDLVKKQLDAMACRVDL